MSEDKQTNRETVVPSFPKEQSNAVLVIDKLIEYAVSISASDIHCDPRESVIDIKFRVNGQIESVGRLQKSLLEEFIARLKILSGARTDIHNIPQDGRWRASVVNKEYNIRISFMPTYHGENAVLRILPAKVGEDLSFARLGFSPDHVKLIGDALDRKHGLILVTGPTGSGKTTTLHTCLSLKSKEPLSIITLEDPVEYEIDNIRQIHIRQNVGLTFASGLRAALRQDPDVIMVGEIRDNETAKVAIHTALTGHLVFSTLHTNSALESIPRLIDMEIDNYLLASTLKLIIAQRLVRNMCHECSALGCERCRYTGYLGRSIIAEVCEVDAGLRELIAKRATYLECVEYTKARGFRSISEDSQEKIDWGITTREEVMNILNNDI